MPGQSKHLIRNSCPLSPPPLWPGRMRATKLSLGYWFFIDSIHSFSHSGALAGYTGGGFEVALCGGLFSFFSGETLPESESWVTLVSELRLERSGDPGDCGRSTRSARGVSEPDGESPACGARGEEFVEAGTAGGGMSSSSSLTEGAGELPLPCPAPFSSGVSGTVAGVARAPRFLSFFASSPPLRLRKWNSGSVLYST